ncbi:xylose isomerase [Enterococcus sp. JM4C]|uniref:sugar phosphate isomerase/epimerase family protein n=1 Tax=Candidatus Enterococcus huntleyi TaxID=1857217 RepID=UPI00137B30D2|nr:sugar phosphate isomerase/epimerase family protein [Enterococcus sp. JM4C]KAF1299613.1 xylose isomerase [Enterococcus sp. JM4C]
MHNFVITGFADEIDPDLHKQISGLKANGITHIELRSIGDKNVSELSEEEALAYKKILDGEGIVVSSIGSPIGKADILADFDEQMELFKHVLTLARIFESPYIRMFSFYLPEGEPIEQYRDEVINRWQQFLTIAKAYPEITLLHENEKDIFGDIPSRCLDLVNSLNNPQLKLAFDPANFVQCGIEVYPYAYQLLKDHIGYLHIKDALFETGKVVPAGEGDGNVKEVLERLVAQGYTGYASLEPHLTIFESFTSLEKSGLSIDNNQGDGEKLFTLASDALKHILVDEMNQEWK